MVTVRSIDQLFKPKDGETLTSLSSFKKRDVNNKNFDDMHIEESLYSKKKKTVAEKKLEETFPFKNLNLVIKRKNYNFFTTIDSPRPASELDKAATKIQKAYKSYRTRRNLADCAVVVEELWWKALDFASLRRSSISFFESDRTETAVSRWARARTRAAKVGKGLSKDGKAQKLALRHWLEAIDPRHRYGHNLYLYYKVWFGSESSQPFFYWLDVGDGKEVNLESTCPRTQLQCQCIKYLGPKEREAYEVIVVDGKLVYRQSGKVVETVEGTKWIFVLSASRTLYVGKKEKGLFQHSSFLAGGAAIAAGRLIAHEGVLEAVWSYSGHYRLSEENFLEFISFLKEQNLDMTNVKKYPMDDDIPPSKDKEDGELKLDCIRDTQKIALSNDIEDVSRTGQTKANSIISDANKEENMNSSFTIAKVNSEENMNSHMAMGNNNNPSKEATVFDVHKKPISCQWSTGAGPRIGCVREYPPQLQLQALEHVNLSPRVKIMPPGSFTSCGPIPSPRPSPKIHLSPRISCMGLSSPRVHIPNCNNNCQVTSK